MIIFLVFKKNKIYILDWNYTYGDMYQFKIQNYSEYEIEKIVVNKFVHSKKDSTFLYELIDSLVLDVDSNLGKSMKTDIYTFSVKKHNNNDQYLDKVYWSIYGINPSDVE